MANSTSTELERFVREYLGDATHYVWEKQQRALLALARTCRESGIELRLVLFPMLHDLDDYAYQDVEDEIQRFAREAGIPSFSLLEGFRGRDARSLWVAEHDQHPNEEGHRIAADALLPYMREALAAVPPR